MEMTGGEFVALKVIAQIWRILGLPDPRGRTVERVEDNAEQLISNKKALLIIVGLLVLFFLSKTESRYF
ncbi:hypothetical protein ACINLE_13015 [Bacillus sp. z60-18]|uniref:hypothetical protein n=1 Tax=Bacillus TaxID=1386 RepID=UPI00098A1A3B|nr:MULTISPECIES: hypothetical protein [Bacillus]WFA06690.1 hypothetical protein P3X63_07940 [Bacillus sp. HSf4]